MIKIMKKYIIGLFAVSFILAPFFSYAQVEDIDPNPDASQCVSLLSSNLRYKSRDANTNNEVSTLQDFLQSKNYLTTEPTGYFGLLTVKAVKYFQKANSINPTGYVGLVTRTKIKSLTCGDMIPDTNVCCEIFGYGAYMVKTSSAYEMMPKSQCTVGSSYVGGGRNIVKNDYCNSISTKPVISGVSGPQSLGVNETGTWTVSVSNVNGGNLAYSVVWGDEMGIARQGTLNMEKASVFQQSATFTHSYSQPGTYSPKFSVTNSNGQSASTSLSVNVGDLTYVPSITVLSPNGGEVLFKGNNKIINWNDSSVYNCPVGANCITMPPSLYYDISLAPYYAPCTSTHCLAMPFRAPYTIIKGFYGSAYTWQVGDVLNSNESSEIIAPSGSYTIKVCKTGTEVCDSSDNPFTIQ
jgi:peptidoglycan hydrolase-like protein with peptidoglycan-binding domain